MEVLTMESVAFKTLVAKIDQIATHIKGQERQSNLTEDEMVDTSTAMQMLSVSSSTLYRMRRDDEIKYSIIRGKCLYRVKDIEEYIQRCQITSKAHTLEEMKQNYNIRTKGGVDGGK